LTRMEICSTTPPISISLKANPGPGRGNIRSTANCQPSNRITSVQIASHFNSKVFQQWFIKFNSLASLLTNARDGGFLGIAFAPPRPMAGSVTLPLLQRTLHEGSSGLVDKGLAGLSRSASVPRYSDENLEKSRRHNGHIDLFYSAIDDNRDAGSVNSSVFKLSTIMWGVLGNRLTGIVGSVLYAAYPALR
jgi:hypothetical protein